MENPKNQLTCWCFGDDPTSRAESGVFVVSIETVWSAVAEVLDGDAGAVSGTLERLVRVTGFTYNSTEGLRKEWSPRSKYY